MIDIKLIDKARAYARKRAIIKATLGTIATIAGFGLIVFLAYVKPILLAVLAGLLIIGFVRWIIFDSER